MSATAFDRMYEGHPPWEIGSPQPFIEPLVRRGVLTGDVLDVGCGTGENALYMATQGLVVHGVDFASRAIEIARRKAMSRELTTRFEVRDALDLEAVREGRRGLPFDSILDSGVFHVFSDEERPRYARNLAAMARPGTSLVIVCMSENEPDWGGPRRVTQKELRATFGAPWAIESIEATRYATLLDPRGAAAWMMVATYVGRTVSRGN